MSQELPPIIIIKKKGGHGGHHGGAWKVAYADFVTAMMALFIVLWLLNSSVQVRKAVSAYFTDPSGSGKLSGSASAGTGETVSVSKDDMQDLKDKLEQAMKKSPDLAKLKDYVQMSVTGEGLRVEMLESEKGMFFQSGSSAPSGLGEELILALTVQLAGLPNNVMIEGHTDAKPFNKRADYSNWELSTDRANAARRLMESHGLPQGKVIQVRGFAAQNLRDPAHPEDAKNRRVSVIVRYQDVKPDDEENADAEGGEKKEGAEGADKKEGGEKKEGPEKHESKDKKEDPPKGEHGTKEAHKDGQKEGQKEAAKERAEEKAEPKTKSPEAPKEKVAEPKAKPHEAAKQKAPPPKVAAKPVKE